MTLVLQGLDASGALVVDFNDDTGVNNGGIRTNVRDINSGEIPQNLVTFSGTNPGGLKLNQRSGLRTWSWLTMIRSAGSADGIRAFASTINRYIDGAGDGRYLKFQASAASEVLYIDFLGAEALSGLLRGQELGVLKTFVQFHDPEGLPVVIVAQPFLRKAEITSSAVAVPNDPAASSGMIFEGTIEGNAPAPVSIKIASQGGNIRRAVVALFQGDGQSDYVASRKFFQAESGTLSGDTASVVDADASGGNAAECTHTTNPTVNAKRVRIALSTLLTPLKRELAIFCRMKATAASVHEVQLRWAPSLADPAPYTEDVIPLSSTNAASHGYVFKRLGTIRIPEDIPVAGAVIELWSRRVSGTGNLRFDFVAFVPADAHVTELSVPGGSESSWLGKDLVTPVVNPAGTTAGSVSEDRMHLDTNGDAAGNPPNTGTAYGSGRVEATFDFDGGLGTPVNTAEIRVRNITDSVTTVSQTVIPSGGGREQHTLSFDAVAGKVYQLQIARTAGTQSLTRVYSISSVFVPSLLTGEAFLSDPDGNRAYKIDSTSSVVQNLSSEGGIPAWIEAGPFALLIHVLDIEKPGYSEGESVLSRSPLVSITHSPRVSM